MLWIRNCNVVATEHGRFVLSCTYTVESERALLGLYSMLECFITAGHCRYGLLFMWKTVERAMLSAVFI